MSKLFNLLLDISLMLLVVSMLLVTVHAIGNYSDSRKGLEQVIQLKLKGDL